MFNDQVKNLQQLHESLIENYTFHSCINCYNFSNNLNSRCNKFDSVPPPKVIAIGCDEWVSDDIPF